MLTCCYEELCWHRRWHGNVIGGILEYAHNAALAHPSIGVTSVFAGNAVISSMNLVFKTGVSSDPAQAGSIPVRLRNYINVFSLLTGMPVDDTWHPPNGNGTRSCPRFWSPVLAGRAAVHLRQQSSKRPDDSLSSLR
jgi:hypothetical protein